MQRFTTSAQIQEQENGTFKNILRKDNIRIFNYRNKFVLVDSRDCAFLMFETINLQEQSLLSGDKPTVRLVEYPLNCKLSSLPPTTKVPFSQVSQANLEYICNVYVKSPVGFLNSKKQRDIAHRISERYGVSYKFARFLSQLPKDIDLVKIVFDLEEAHFYLSNKPNWQKILKEGSFMDKKEILKKLLPPETYELFNITTSEIETVYVVSREIFSIK